MLDQLARLIDQRPLPRRSKGPALRMSALGKCARQLSARIHGIKEDGHVTDHRGHRTFRRGDEIEDHVVDDIREGLYQVEELEDWKLKHVKEGQLRVRLDLVVDEVGPLTIWGSPDGVLEHRRGLPPVLLEVKSMNRRGFDWRMKLAQPERWVPYKGKPGQYNKGGVGDISWTPKDSYYHQNQGYMHASSDAYPMGFTRSLVVAEDKDTQARTSWMQYRDGEWLAMIREHLRLAHKPFDQAPRRLPDGQIIEPKRALSEKTGQPLKGHGELGFPCTYCPFYRACWAKEGVEEELVTGFDQRTKRVLTIKQF